RQDKGASAGSMAYEFQMGSQMIGQLFADGEADSAAAVFAGLAGCEQVGLQVRGYSRAFVAHLAGDVFTAVLERERHRLPFGRGLQRVLREVQQYQSDQIRG